MNQKIFKDETFNNLNISDTNIIPTVNVNTEPIKPEGSIIYDNITQALFYSNGLSWKPVMANGGNFIDSQTFIVDQADHTKRLGFDIQGVTNTTTTLITNPTVNRTFTLPDISGTSIVSQDTTNFVFINQPGTLHGSNSLIQASTNSSTIPAQSAQIRLNQYGNNANVPGISTFKSRSSTIGGLQSVIDGDILYGVTAVGVAPDNVSIPLSGLIRILVPSGGSVPGHNWIATDYQLQLVPLNGPINGRKEAFRVTSEGILHIKESPNTMAGIAILAGAGVAVISNTQVTATSKFTLTVQDGGTVPTGTVYISSRIIGTSFTITSNAGAIDNGVRVYYQLWEPTLP